MPPATPHDSSIVRGYRGIRELLGVSMDTVSALVRFDAERQPPVLARVPSDRRATLRAHASDVWALFREFEAARAALPSVPTKGESPAQER